MRFLQYLLSGILGLLFFTVSAQNNSVLSTGDWYKIAVTQDGIYKIDRSFLQSLGINVNDLDPRKLALYGKPGGMLPQRNDANMYYDPTEIAVHVEGEADGKFDDGDYLQFYGQSAHQGYYQPRDNRFYHLNHLYDNTTYYYLHIKNEPAKRITTRASLPGDNVADRGRVFSFIDNDKNNLLKMGRLWFDDKMETNRMTYRIPVPNLVQNQNVRVEIRVAARGGEATQFIVRESGRQIGTINVRKADVNLYFGIYAEISTGTFMINEADLTDGSIDLEIEYKRSGISTGWVDYVKVDAPTKLQTNVLPFTFYAIASDTTQSQQLQFGGDLSNLYVWDITDPMNVVRQKLSDGKNNAFGISGKPSKWLVAHPQSGEKPTIIGKMANQNLHGLPAFDYLIVTHPLFSTQANELADLHRNFIPNSDGTPKRVQVVNIFDIYNEFSAGSEDLTAIRNMLKLYYDRYQANPKDQPKYLLLFGDGGYNNKGINGGKKSLIPTYQARESLDPTSAFTSDEYLTFMEDKEGFWAEGTGLYDGDVTLDVHTMDLTVGRLPVNTVTEARNIVEKIKNYVISPQTAGDWMQRVLLIGDYKREDGGRGECNHMMEADGLDRSFIRPCAPCLQTDKIYYDQFPMVQMAEGPRFPEGKRAMMERLQAGQLLVNYTGHGSEVGLSNSYFFEIPDMLALRNGPRLPFWVTATCEFGRYDDADRTCGIEYLLLNPNGGAIGTMTSVRMVYSGGNEIINRNFYDFLFCKNQNYTTGDAFRLAKNRTLVSNNININTRCFSFLGDPALYLGKAKHQAIITKINNEPIDPFFPDTLKALSKVTLAGEIQDANGNLIPDFNGTVTVTTLDKSQTKQTINCQYNYQVQKNRIFSGQASVTDGKFQIRFTVPLDISYEIGQGKIQLFAVSDQASAAGCTDKVIVCCTDEKTVSRCDAVPSVKVFIDNPDWQNGGLTSPTPLLYVEVADSMGMNTTGLGVGRQLTAILNGNESQPIILNEAYRSAKNNYQRGTIIYRMPELPEGKHTVQVKVWNVCNNSATGTTTFRIGKNLEMVSVNVYPNPMTDETKFTFNYNQYNDPIQIRIHIYSTTGQLVRSLAGQLVANESIYTGMDWDGKNDLGQDVPNGVYSYKLSVTNTKSGEEVFGHGKIIRVR
jgi:hypothetical protein